MKSVRPYNSSGSGIWPTKLRIRRGTELSSLITTRMLLRSSTESNGFVVILAEFITHCFIATYDRQSLQSPANTHTRDDVVGVLPRSAANLDGGAQTPEDYPNPTAMGYSIGHWEGATLVVDTRGFKESPAYSRWKSFGNRSLHRRSPRLYTTVNRTVLLQEGSQARNYRIQL